MYICNSNLIRFVETAETYFHSLHPVTGIMGTTQYTRERFY
jgi:hypothetical protein